MTYAALGVVGMRSWIAALDQDSITDSFELNSKKHKIEQYFSYTKNATSFGLKLFLETQFAIRRPAWLLKHDRIGRNLRLLCHCSSIGRYGDLHLWHCHLHLRRSG